MNVVHDLECRTLAKSHPSPNATATRLGLAQVSLGRMEPGPLLRSTKHGRRKRGQIRPSDETLPWATCGQEHMIGALLAFTCTGRGAALPE